MGKNRVILVKQSVWLDDLSGSQIPLTKNNLEPQVSRCFAMKPLLND